MWTLILALFAAGDRLSAQTAAGAAGEPKPMRVLPQRPATRSPVYEVNYSPDGRTLVATTLRSSAAGEPAAQPNREVRLWDVRTGRLRRTIGAAYSARFSPDGQWLTVAHQDTRVTLTPVSNSGTPMVLRPDEAVSEIVFSPDSRFLALTTDGDEPQLQLWRVKDGKALIGPRAPRGGLFGAAGQMVLNFEWFSADSRRICAWDEKGEYAWDLTTGRRVSRAKTSARHRTLAPNGKLVAGVELGATHYPETVTLRDAATGKRVAAIHGPKLPAFRYSNDVHLHFSPDGRRLIAVWEPDVTHRSVPCAVQLFYVPNQRLIATIQDSDAELGGTIPDVDFTPDSRQFLIRGGYTLSKVKIRDSRTGHLLKVLASSPQAFISLSPSPDGKTLAAGGGDGMVRLWALP